MEDSTSLRVNVTDFNLGGETRVVVVVDNQHAREYDITDSDTVELTVPVESQRVMFLTRDRAYASRPGIVRAGAATAADFDLISPTDLGDLITRSAEVLSERLTGKPYEGIAKAADVETSGNLVGLIPQSAVPTNRVLERMTLRFFDVSADSPLLLGSGWVPGLAVDYEISRESAGWALHDWIGTRALAPYQDTALADSLVDTTATTSQGEHLREAIGETQADNGTATSREASEAEAKATSTGTGINAGIGQESDTSGTDPVTKLTQALTGAVQLGFDWSHGRSSATQQSALERAISERFQRDVTYGRDGRVAASAQTSSGVSDTRSLTALRNLTGKTLNLATFSIAHQWRIATVVADCRPVVYIPIDRMNETITVHDAFLNHSALDRALTDSDLRRTLKEISSGYAPDLAFVALSPPKEVDTDKAQQEVKRVTGSVTFSDPGEGKGSNVRLAVSFRDGEEYVEFDQSIEDTATGAPKPISIEVNRPLRSYGGATIMFVNPWPAWDKAAGIKAMHLVAVLNDDTEVTLHDIRDERVDVQAPVELPSPFHPNLISTRRSSGNTTPADVSRLLDHLNHQRAYYRLAIDLQLDSATRFARLKERLAKEVPPALAAGMGAAVDSAEAGRSEERSGQLRKILPVSFDPLGVVGGYLAFGTARENASPKDRQEAGVGANPEFFLASTLSPGTFTEAIRGATEVGSPKDAPSAPQIPSGPKDSNVTYPWPERVQPSAAAIDKVFTSSGRNTQTGEGLKAQDGTLATPANETPGEAEKARAKAATKAKAGSEGAGASEENTTGAAGDDSADGAEATTTSEADS